MISAADFYGLCYRSGYEDLNDPFDHKHIELLAIENNIDYSNIDEYFNQAKEEYLRVQKEKEEKALIAKEEEKRRAVNGNLLCVVETRGRRVSVYKRPDLSVYCELPSSRRPGSYNYREHRRVEGVGFSVRSHTDTAFKMVPSKTIYTGSVVGGVSTGGFHQTRAGYDFLYNKTGLGFVTVRFGDEDAEDVCSIELCDLASYLYKDKYKGGLIKCMDVEAGKGFQMMTEDRSKYDVYQIATMVSAKHHREAYSMNRCGSICDFIRWYIQYFYPYTKDDKKMIYTSADSLANGNDIENLRIATKMFLFIKNYKDASDRAIQARNKIYDIEQKRRLEQERIEKERAEKKRIRAEKLRLSLLKALRITALSLTVIIVALVCFIFLINPRLKYGKAMRLIDSGNYSQAYRILEDIGEEEVIENNKFDRAMKLLDSGNIEDACELMEEIGKESSSELGQRCNYELGKNAMSSGELVQAKNYFEEAGDYNDTKDYLKLIDIRFTLNDSLIAGYRKLCDFDTNLPEVEELKDLCEIYIPYCGDYYWCIDGHEASFNSDFSISNDGSINWLFNGETPYLDGRVAFYEEKMIVEDMSITNILNRDLDFVVNVYFENDRISTRFSGYLTYDTDGQSVYNLQDFYDSGEIIAEPE